MARYRVLLDTNVIIAALRSTKGASRKLLDFLAAGRFEIVTSVALHLEYEEQLQRLVDDKIAAQSQVDDVMDFLSLVAIPVGIRYRLRPFLRDADDDFVLELAFAAGVNYFVTHNVRDFAGSEKFGVKVVRSGEMVRLLEQES